MLLAASSVHKQRKRVNENETDAVGCVLTARKVYTVFGAEAQVETDYFEGKHQISGKRAYDFLTEKLSVQP